jgi:4-diphosphocytidyl-2-C-methyl-D-erythritol kinase
MQRLQTTAPAKVNLTLRVLARRPDGHHELASLVAFASVGDELVLETGASLALTVEGPMAAAAGTNEGNLVLKTAQALIARIAGLRIGHFVLEKRLPAGAGLGGGSADAAAALRLLARLNDIALDDRRLVDAARAVGADVPACVESRARIMHGIGDELSEPLLLPPLNAVLCFPGVAAATSAVFRAYVPTAGRRTRYSYSAIPAERVALIEFLAGETNDLEKAAISVVPAIAEAKALMEQTGRPELVRMTGSGSAIFAIHEDETKAARAAAEIRNARPGWWAVAATLN